MTFLDVPPALDWPVQFCAFATAATFVASIVTSNVSQVDRLWTFLPTIYTAYYALLPLWPNTQPFFLFPYSPKDLGWTVASTFSPRASLMFGLIVIWMCRLSYNTYRRGLFNLKDEDYRWAVLRQQLPPWLFQIVNLTFISGIQNLLLLWLGLPTRTAATQPHTALATSDYLLAAAALTVLAFEFTSDNQQYAFHAYKHAFLAKEKGSTNVEAYDESKQWPGARLNWTPDDARRGFVTRGLWRYSRHPNFACEQTFWWIITFFPLLAPAAPNLPSQSDFPPLRVFQAALYDSEIRKDLISFLYNLLAPTALNLLPAIALSALFFSSTAYTEAITSGKYTVPYKAYQKRVGMFGPMSTFEKGLGLLLWGSKEEKGEVERLVWGNSAPKTGKI
ncbi:hypothetical protein BDQ12DRAFT_680546, partial [Crucibulum laeve]